MKFYYILLLLICYILFPTSLSRKVHSRKTHRYLTESKTKNGLYYEIAFSVFSEVSNIKEKDINECIPKEWRSTQMTPNPKHKTIQASFGEQYPIWSKVGGYLGTVINYVCRPSKIYDECIQYLIDLIKNGRRRRRLFLHGKRRHKKWLESLYETASIIGSAAVAVTKVVGGVALGVATAVGSWTIEKVKEYIKDYFIPVFKLINEFLRTEITKLLKDDFVVTIVKIYKCVSRIQLIDKTIGGQYEKWVKLTTGLTNPATWVFFVAGLVCSWEFLLKAIDYMRLGLSALTSLDMWKNFGHTIGILIRIISNIQINENQMKLNTTAIIKDLSGDKLKQRLKFKAEVNL